MRPLCAIVLALASATQAQPSPDPVTTIPKGDYAIARLDLPTGLDGKPQKLILGLRDGRLANFWFVTPQGGDQRLHLEDSTVARQGAATAGKVHIRTAADRGSMASAWLVLDLKTEGERVSGQYELNMAGTPLKSGKGAATGVLESKPPPADALSPAGSWPSFWGANLDMAAQPQPPLVSDWAQARPVWRSEAYVLTGYGNAPDSRYFTRALRSGSGGGGSSPVVSDGTVYVYFYVPSPQSEPALKGNPYWERTYRSEDEFKAAMAKANATPRETAWVLNHFRPAANDVVVAMDAATGATRWATVFPLRSPNLQTHKHRGVSGQKKGTVTM
jgi:hypothetical protein